MHSIRSAAATSPARGISIAAWMRRPAPSVLFALIAGFTGLAGPARAARAAEAAGPAGPAAAGAQVAGPAGLAGPAPAEPQPDAAMMKPVEALVDFMSRLPAGVHPTVFVSESLCIIENFAPFVFCGADAASRWEAGFRAHAREEGLEGLKVRFGPAHDLLVQNDRVYFSLPTQWTGRTHGRPFVEKGAWAFVLGRESRGYRILGYGWGVYSYRESR
jgi:hypothetical protein